MDFGAGPCDKTAVLQMLGYRCSAYDDFNDEWHLGENYLDRIRTFATGVGIDLRSADDGAPCSQFEASRFDMVMLHDVLEHLHDSPRDLLIELLQLVKARGLLYVRVPNAVNVRKRWDVLRGRTNLPAFSSYFWSTGPWRGHVREYTKGDLTDLARYMGLEVLELGSCHHMLRKVPSYARTPYLAATRAIPGWRDSWQLVARKPTSWGPAHETSPSLERP